MNQEKKDKKIYFGGHLVAFLDLLGQSDGLSKLKEISWWDFQEETRKILSETYGRVKKFRNGVDHYLKRFGKPTPMDTVLMNVLGGEELEIHNHFGENKIIKKGIADSIILNFPLVPSGGLLPLKSIYGVLGACASNLLLSLYAGYTIRGAIEIGPCIYNLETSEVYGTALSDAVKYEKEAFWPRIVIGPELIKYIEESKRLPKTTPTNRVNISCADLCLKLISRDEEGKYFLDYLSPNFSEIQKLPNLDVILEKATIFIKTELKRNEARSEVRDKFAKLKAYFIERGINKF